VVLGAELFFWSRLAYIPVYYAGIPYLRTAIYFISVTGLAMMATALLNRLRSSRAPVSPGRVAG
jgi:uncharacterized MAPEG superfamily protein